MPRYTIRMFYGTMETTGNSCCVNYTSELAKCQRNSIYLFPEVLRHSNVIKKTMNFTNTINIHIRDLRFYDLIIDVLN